MTTLALALQAHEALTPPDCDEPIDQEELEALRCVRCGGAGSIGYDRIGPEEWAHVEECRACEGEGTVRR